jgi:choline-sulfatase
VRPDALGSLGMLPPLRTPVMDEIVAGGVRFAHGYTPNPVCVPAREAVVTGRWAHRFGCMENGGPRSDPSLPTFPRLLQEAGYVTFAAGKQHFRPVREHRGYGRLLLSEGQPAFRQDDDYLLHLRDAGYGRVTQPGGRRGPHYYEPQESPLPPELHVTPWTARRCAAFIRANRDRPFLCTAAFFKPHPPFDPPRTYWERYPAERVTLPVPGRTDEEDAFLPVQNHKKSMDAPDEARVRAVRSAYYALVEQIDDGLGLLLQTLRDCGVLEDTLVVVSADHGELLGDHGAWGKRSFYEPSAGVPLWLHWPAGLPRGVVRETPVSTIDLFPTFASAAGLPLPGPLDGLDLLPAARGDAVPDRAGVPCEYGEGAAFKLMWSWQEGAAPSGAAGGAVRNGGTGGTASQQAIRQWKYVWLANGGREQLFDLAADPLERNNLAAAEPDRCRRAHDALVAWCRETDFAGALAGTARDGRLVARPFEHIPFGPVNEQVPAWPARDPDFA